jgi:protein-S-isoprenylcysteine O-methyltransferase Ste14
MLYPVIPLGFLLALIAVLLGYPDAAACIIMLLWFGWLLAIIFRDAIRLQEKKP